MWSVYGDTIFQWGGRWRTFDIPEFGGSKADLAKSLSIIRDLKPDIVMSSGFIGKYSEQIFKGNEWVNIIDENISSLTGEI